MSDQNTQFQDEIDASSDTGRMNSIDESSDDVGFIVQPSQLVRPRRKSMEPGVVRSLLIAAIVGVGIGTFMWAFKPLPRGAEAAPAQLPSKLQNTSSVPVSGSLFDLPEWDEAAYQRDKAASAGRR